MPFSLCSSNKSKEETKSSVLGDTHRKPYNSDNHDSLLHTCLCSPGSHLTGTEMGLCPVSSKQTQTNNKNPLTIKEQQKPERESKLNQGSRARIWKAGLHLGQTHYCPATKETSWPDQDHMHYMWLPNTDTCITNHAAFISKVLILNLRHWTLLLDWFPS